MSTVKCTDCVELMSGGPQIVVAEVTNGVARGWWYDAENGTLNEVEIAAVALSEYYDHQKAYHPAKTVKVGETYSVGKTGVMITTTADHGTTVEAIRFNKKSRAFEAYELPKAVLFE